MAKAKTIYVCKECGARDPKGGGRCMRCGTWGSFEAQVTGGPKPTLNSKGPIPTPRPLSEVPMNEGEVRLRVGIGELDRVLGGGLVTGSLTLIGGDPGVGKSTLLLMVLAAFALVELTVQLLATRINSVRLTSKNSSTPFKCFVSPQIH